MFGRIVCSDSVAVIGATERPGTVGRTVLSNLMESRSRSKVYAVNPSHSEVLGLKAYKSIGDISEKVDLAVVVTPAVTVSNVVGECAEAGVRAAVVISAGFRERGPEGAALEQQIQQQLRRGTMRLIGPNCLGIMNPAIGLNATFASGMPKAGNVAFLQPERRINHCNLGLESARRSGLQRDRLDWLNVGCGLGRLDRLLWR